MSKRVRRSPYNCANYDTELCNPKLIRNMDDVDWREDRADELSGYGGSKKIMKTAEGICLKCKHFKEK